MKRLTWSVLALVASCVFGTALAADPAMQSTQPDQRAETGNQSGQTARYLDLRGAREASAFDRRYLVKTQASMSCGLAPLPPLGCRVGSCVCDQSGQNCRWTFICN